MTLVQKTDSELSRGSQAPLHSSSTSNEGDTLHTYSSANSMARLHIEKGTITPNYEADNADYSTPVFLPADREEDLKTQLARLGIDEIPEDQLQ